jgi:hypothetical protein
MIICCVCHFAVESPDPPSVMSSPAPRLPEGWRWYRGRIYCTNGDARHVLARKLDKGGI